MCIPILRQHVRALVLTPTLELATQVHNHFTRLAAGSGLKSLVLSKVGVFPSLSRRRHWRERCNRAQWTAWSARHCGSSAPSPRSRSISRGNSIFPLFPQRGDADSGRGRQAIRGGFSAANRRDFGRVFVRDAAPPALLGDAAAGSSAGMHSIQGVESLARTVLRDPVRVVVGRRNASSDHVTQTLKYCGTEEGKLLAFRAMLREGFEPPMLVFVQSKERARQLFAEVAYESGAREEVTSRRERRRHPQRYVAQGAAGGRHTLPHR